ncbi:protein ASPARTIC PROTEASE IN GUARD CELL 1-like [Trifolium pratense]|uniref:Protein ASPARTIC PROTEASE IN GUARD CELL 1-like n=1 Tax=Trifolium pratense TaxID=57577 RepID=A0A2K3LKI9_TRIPR|nr:protein ASPARTIC PROTEASE IN GUARD CELL 1-like [Trifolium pratense]
MSLSLFFSLTTPFHHTSNATSSSEFTTSIFNVTSAIHQIRQVLPFHHQEEEETQFSSLSSSSSFKLKLYPIESLFTAHPQHKLDYRSLVLTRLKHDSTRVSRIRSKIQPEFLSGDVFTGITHGTNDYIVKIGVGRPPQFFYMIFDIETDVTWLQCQPCLHCYEQPDSIFDPSLSSSYTLISCETKRCNLLKNSSCSVDGYCKYKISYNDDSYTAGIFVNETISFESSGWVNRVSLGCGHSNKGAFVGSAGTFGLGRGPFSFLSRINVSSMSYCLVDRNWVYSSATLEFNSPSSSSYNNDNSFKAKLLKNPKMESLYYVGFTGVSVGSERITIPNSTFTIDPYGNGGMIVSTGTIITRLETQAYNAVRDAFVAKTQHLERAKALYPFDTCYSLTTKNTIELPMMGFEVNDGKMWLLPKESYLYAVDNNGTFCFAFGPSEGPFSILGSFQQYGTRVTFDLTNSIISLHTLYCS